MAFLRFLISATRVFTPTHHDAFLPTLVRRADGLEAGTAPVSLQATADRLEAAPVWLEATANWPETAAVSLEATANWLEAGTICDDCMTHLALVLFGSLGKGAGH